MQTQVQIGSNRTGIQMSPIDAAAMQAGEDQFAVEADPDDRGDLEVRGDYASESDALGSVPPPATVGGVASAGAALLTGARPHVLIDKLGERLAFERSGVRLYDSLLVKCRAADGLLDDEEVEDLEHFREEEAEHFALVDQALQDLGADPTAQTPCADLAGVEGMGLVQAMNDPRTSVLQALHVTLDAELLDNAAWDRLIELARAMDHADIAEMFVQCADQEARHLARVQEIVRRLTLRSAGPGAREPANAA